MLIMMKLESMSWAGAREALATKPVGLIPIGAVENHGPHLPLATDWISACRISEEAAREGSIILLPGVPVGVSEHHRHFTGTLWVSPDVLRDYVLGIARSAASHGVGRLVFVNGHGGNSAALEQAIRILRKEKIYSYLFEWWNAIPELIAEKCQLPHDHAGDMETSIILAIDPALVDKRKYQEAAAGKVVEWGRRIHGVPIAMDTIDFTESGVVGNPAFATGEKGGIFIEASARELFLFCRWLKDQAEEALAPRDSSDRS
jgi:creatinine amidohydrolase